MTAPVLLLFFNRPDLARRVFDRVRLARPERLFISVDGARPDRPGEAEMVKQNEALAKEVDWPCEVQTLFRGENLGCGPAVSGAISWFFEHVESGIILEDDCVPDESFFPFASELLERYANHDRIMMINGTSYLPESAAVIESYYFSIFDHIWGWASWRRAWTHYDYHLTEWPNAAVANSRLKSLGLLPKWHINRNFALSKSGVINTWDYQWEHAIWANDGMVITPANNLISNIGFDIRATHTFKGDDGRAERPVARVDFPLVHPDRIEVNGDLDLWYRKTFLMTPAMLGRAVLRKIGALTGWKKLSGKRVFDTE